MKKQVNSIITFEKYDMERHCIGVGQVEVSEWLKTKQEYRKQGIYLAAKGLSRDVNSDKDKAS